MNLSQREKILAAGVGLVVLLFVGRYFSTTILKGFDAKNEKKASLAKTQEEQNLKMIEGTIAKVKLNRVAAQSLPSNEEKARAEYMRWLIDLADEAGLQDPQPRALGEAPEPGVYNAFRFQLTGVGTDENATRLLYLFHAKDYLHRILRFDIRPITNSTPPNRLTISMDCEALSLDKASPNQSNPGYTAPRITKPLEEYQNTIAGRNIFAPTNHPPMMESRRRVSATQGLRLDVGLDAKETDPGQFVTYQFDGEPLRGMQLDPNTGKLTWTSSDVGSYEVTVRATDSGIPAKSTFQRIAINVSEPPPPTKKPPEFNVASQAFISALLSDGKIPQAWIRSKTEGKTIYLRKGDELKLGDVKGKVIDVGRNFIELETEGKRWTVGMDESLADAFSRAMAD